MNYIKVTKITNSYAWGGETFGPFEASEATPYLSVPVDLAKALGLTLHESEPPFEEPPAVSKGNPSAENLELKALVEALKEELATIKRLPDDALGRLEAIPGIGKKLAQTALDALLEGA